MSFGTSPFWKARAHPAWTWKKTSAAASASRVVRPECRQPRVSKCSPLRFVEELDVFRVAAGPAALDVVDAELIEPLGDAQLVEDGKRDAQTLAPIAQGRVVDLYPIHVF